MKKTGIWMGVVGALALTMGVGCLAPRIGSVVSGHCVVETDTKGRPVAEVEREMVTRIDGDFLKAQVVVLNAAPWGQSLQYRFTWRTREGMDLKGAETLWNPLALRAGEEAVVEGVSPVPGAADFRLDIRPLNLL